MRILLAAVSLLVPLLAQAAPAKMNVCIYYDSVAADPNYKLGKVYSVMTVNLLGHFNEVVPKVLVSTQYVKGDLDKCDKTIYLGTHYASNLSDDFLKDIKDYKKSFLWINYNIWRLQALMGNEEFQKKTGFLFSKLEQYTPAVTPEDITNKKEPGFFKFFNYKGEVFRKYIRFDLLKNNFVSSPEIARVVNKGAKVLSEAEHSVTHEKTPYVLQKGKFFYVGDTPFSFIHEVDRYLIICDVLFDFLELKPRLSKKYALARIEDLHGRLDVNWLYKIFDIFKARNLPFSMTVIPKFVDNFGYFNNDRHNTDILHSPKFLKALKYATANKGRIFFHGYTHQQENTINCESGTSGDEFEFWDDCLRRPIQGDSEAYVYDRLGKGMAIFKEAGLDYVGWVPPHYQASPLAYGVFAKVFERTMQRIRYIPEGIDPADRINWAGQFFPYTIEKDSYGQFVWPENLGNVRLNYQDPKDANLQMPAEIVAAAKKSLVIRDAWASFFFHPYYMAADEVGAKTLAWMVDEIKKLGYEFVDLKELKESGH